MNDHPESVRSRSKIRYYNVPLFRCCIIALLTLITPVWATPFPLLIGGQVTGLDETNHTLTIISDCNRFTCDRTMPGAYAGTVTNDAVYLSLQTGDHVELMYESWLGGYPCDMGEYKGKCTIPGHEPLPVGQWAGISRVVEGPGTGRWLTTDFFGDPSGSQEHLINNYSLAYEPGPDTDCPVNQSIWVCSAGYVDISLLHFNRTVAETRVLRNATYRYEDPADKTTVTLRFTGGRATSHNIISPGGGPYADMEVHVRPTPAQPVPDSLSPLRSPVTTTSQPAPLQFFGTIVAMGIAVILVFERSPEK